MVDRDGDPDRVLAFTDGVFAIIITILVLDIRVPEQLDESSLADALREVGPTLVAWLISFLIVGMYWVWHRDVFSRVRVVNRDVVWLNLVYLVPVSLIPFAASLIGNYNRDAIALHAYGLVLIVASLVRALLYRYLSNRPELLVEAPSERARRFGLQLALSPIAIYVVAMAVAEPLPRLSLVLYASVPVAYFTVITALRRRDRRRDGADLYS